MKLSSLNKNTVFWGAISALLLLFMVGLLAVAWFVNRPINDARAQLTGHKVALALDSEKITSLPFSPASIHLAPPAAKAPPKIEPKPQPITLKQPEPEKKPAAPIAAKKPRIAIIIGGLALSSSSTERAFKLPPAITFGISPYAASETKWAALATQQKHDVLVNLPMEPINYPLDDMGPYALLTGLPDSENAARLGVILARLEHFAGVYTIPSEHFTLAPKKIQPILENLKSRGYLFVAGNPESGTLLRQVAESGHLPVLVADVVLDQDISEQAIQEKLAELEKIAQNNGTAIALGNPYPLTIKLIERWLPALDAKGIELVPISALTTIAKKE